MAAKKKTSTFLDDLVPVTEEKEEFELSPVPDSLRQIRPTPSTTSPRKPKEDFKLDPDFVPVGEVRTFTDDELFRKIENNLEYRPTDAELDKYLEYKEQNPTGAVDFIKGAWDGAWGVLGEIGSGAKAIASEPLKSLDFFTAEGWERKAANISEAVARSTWDLGVVGREFNELFGRLRDDELREEMKEMKLRQSNPDYRMKGAMGGEAYLSPEQREQLRKTFAVDYIKERISDDLDDIEETTDNFQKPVDQLKREFARRGLTYVEDATKRDYTTANYIDNILDDKQRKKLVDDFPNWMRARQRDRWRRTRYMQRISERARRGDQTIIGEFFGPEFDEKFRKVVNPQVATLLSYAGGAPEVAGALATRIPRKGLTAGAALTDPLQTAPTLGGKATELAGKALRKGGEKVQRLGEYITESEGRSAAAGGLIGALGSEDLASVPMRTALGAGGGLIEQNIRILPKTGRALQSAGETAQAIGEVVGRPGGTEGILKAASRVAPTEETAKKLNTISFLDPAINLASDLGKGAATGSFVGLALAAPSEDAGVMGAGFGGGLTGGFVGSGAGRFLTKGELLRNQQQNDWEQFRQRLSPKQIESIKKYAPDINTMGQVMNQVRMLEGVLTPESRGNVDFDFISPKEFENRFGAARGAVVTGNRVKPEIIINTGWRGPNSLFHEAWHAMKRFAGNTEQMKVRNEEGKLEQKDYPALQPYLKKIQTILFGEELGGQQVVKGLYDKDTILKDFADQYTDKMTDEQKAKWEDSFKQDPVTKEKFTPEQAEQNKLNYLMEELEAESFRYLMSGSDPRGIASGQRSLTQKFVDHMLLAEHSKTLRGMKKALSSVGIRFKGSGEPSDIFAEKDSKGRWRGLTNSPELNAALRDYVRAWEGLQYRTRYIDDVEPSGFQIGGEGVTGSRVVEFQLRKPENNFLREHFKSSDIIKKDDKGEPVLMPDGVTLELLSEGQIRKLQEDRSELIRKALEDTEDPNGMTSKVNEKGEVSFKGVPTPRQLDAIDTIPSNILTPNQKQIIREVSTMMSDDPGAPLQFLYNAAIGRGKRYSSSLSSSHRIAVPLGFHASKAKNFYFTALDLGAYHNKLKAWADDTKKALHKGGHKLALWDKDVKAFEADLFKYLENHKNGRPGDTGLAPDQKTAEQKRNVLNDFFNINKGEDAQGTQSNFNPIAAARRAVDPKTGKQKKRAYRNLENLIRSYRLDRVLDEDFGKSLSYSLGKPLPMKSQADFYQRQLENFMALPNQQGGQVFIKGEKSPVKVTDKSNSDSITLRMFSDDVDADFDLRAVEGEGGTYTLINGVPRQQLGGLSMSVIDRLFKKSGISGKFVEFTEVAPEKAQGGKTVEAQTYGIFKGRPKEAATELEKIVKPLVESGLVDSFEYAPTFKQGERVRLESKDEGRKSAQFESNLLNDLGVIRSMLPTLDKYPNLKSQLDLALNEMFSVETMKPAPEIPFAKGDPISAAQRLRNTAEQSSYSSLLKAVVEMNDAELGRLNKLKSADDTTLFYEDNPRFMPAPAEGAFNKAKETFGTTQDLLEAGYILPDGEMLDFSGRHEGADERDIAGQRYSDHREISQAGVEMQPFIDSGAVRIDARSGLIDIGKNPTASQFNQIRKIIEDKDSEVHIDLENEGQVEAIEPEVGTDPKRVIGLIKRFYRGDDISSAVRFMPQPTFYSKAERAVEGAKAGIFNKEGMTSVGQAKALLQKNAPETELEWSGVLDYLDLQKEEGNKVSKQDLLSYLKNNGVEVEEVLRGPKEMPTQDQVQALKEKPDTISVQEGIERIREGKRVHVEKVNEPHKGHLIELFDLVSLEDSDSVYLQDIEKGEFRLRKGGVDTGGMLEMKPMPSGMRDSVKTPTLFDPTEQFAGGPAVLPGGENYRELVLKLPDSKLPKDSYDVPSGHRFPEENILAHIRFTERTDADGKRMLFLDEVQSDWNSEIRERGVRKERPESIQRERDELEAEGYKIMESDAYKHISFLNERARRAEKLEEVELDFRLAQLAKETMPYDQYFFKEGNYKEKKKELTQIIENLDKKIKETENEKYSDLYDTPEKLKQHFRDVKKRMHQIDTDFPKYPKGAPDMPYKGSKWQDLVMKRMIRWAADNGYDRLGWITGKDTADRYDLSKAVDEIKYIPEQQRLIASRGEYGKQSYERVVDKEQVTPDNLESYIGKDLAKKLIESPEKEGGVEGEGDIVKTRVLSGKDLQISPAWAENLYDKSLPKIARKLTKKKGAVGRVGIFGSSSKLNGALAKNGIKPKYEANYVDISPEVKELAQEGFSYFMPEGRGGTATAPVQAAAPQPPSGVIIPKVKLTEDEKEESRKLLQQLLD